MNGKSTYREWVRRMDTQPDHVKTLVLAHLAAFGPLGMGMLIQLVDEYESVSPEFLEHFLNNSPNNE